MFKLFDSFTSEQSLWFIAFNVGSLLIGMFIIWLFTSGALRRLRKENIRLLAENSTMSASQKVMSDKDLVLQAELRRAREEVSALNISLAQAETAKRDAEQQQTNIRAELSTTKLSLNRAAEEIDALKAAVSGGRLLLTEPAPPGPNPLLEKQLAAAEAEKAALAKQLADASKEVDFIQNPPPGFEGKVQASGISDLMSQDGLYNINANPSVLIEDNDKMQQALQKDLQTKHTTPVVDTHQAPEPVDDYLHERMVNFFRDALVDTTLLADQEQSLPVLTDSTTSESPAVVVEFPPLEIHELDNDQSRLELIQWFATMLPAPPGQKDDLRKITGVGPSIEKKLNNIGIMTYWQLMQLDDEMVGKVNDVVQSFPGRMQRDNWVGQAKALYDAQQHQG